ncbi:F-box/FBD/LRR-repeat protein At1g13570-like isoform X2 [Rutidosis leptorrhynchoides]|uniref:F-box/FBD/LRR-repeat protein At1g13570-like isoform X2 n=1 Tax=Rutidosis leptorrhynchoides TaxID=125765 RepID=UPI003A997D38
MNAQRLLLDGTITTLPSNIIENILWLLPIEEIVRTSLLSKEWRYNWTKVPKVAFIEDLFHDSMFDESSGENQLPVDQGFEESTSESEMQKMIRRHKFFYAIYQFLLLHQGPIVDFTLSMRSSDATNDCAEIDQILLHLSRKNTVKKLRLSSMCDLPLSIFSFHQLTELYLSDCSICHVPPFNRFRSLTTLCLKDVRMYKKTLMHILSNNPLLKSLTMVTDGCSIILTRNDEYGTINELFQCLPLIEYLSFYVWDIESFGKGVVPRELATSLVHLKFLQLERMCFLENNWFQFLVLIIKSSPNLEKLTLKIQKMSVGWTLTMTYILLQCKLVQIYGWNI